jgi:hypothetical protein
MGTKEKGQRSMRGTAFLGRVSCNKHQHLSFYIYLLQSVLAKRLASGRDWVTIELIVEAW